MKEGREGSDEKVLSAKRGQGSEQVTTRNNRFHTSTEGTKFNWRGNTGKSRHYWDGCYWALCAHHVYTHTLHTLRIEVQIVDLCIRSRKTGVHAAVTTLKESNDLHCGCWVLEEKHVYLLFLPPVFAKKLPFLLVVAATLGQEEARRGKENGFNYRKKGPVRTGCYNRGARTIHLHVVCF